MYFKCSSLKRKWKKFTFLSSFNIHHLKNMTVMAWDPEKESSKWYKNPFKPKSSSDAYVQLQNDGWFICTQVDKMTRMPISSRATFTQVLLWTQE